jgi:hypothetical protein
MAGSNASVAMVRRRQQETALADHSKKNPAHDQLKVNRAEDAKKALSEYEADTARTLAKTERLKALRLARDAAEGQAPRKSTEPAKKKAVKQAKDKPTLSQWLKERQGAGWRN